MNTGSTPSYVIVIPARLGSTRLAEKILLEAAGDPLVIHTWRTAQRSQASRVVIAADDPKTVATVEARGAEVILTGEAASGTDRIAACVRALGLQGETIVVNLQADEPQMPVSVLDQLATALAADPGAALATACCPIEDGAELFNPNAVKVVLDARDRALYFSRAPLPYERDRFDQDPPKPAAIAHFRHLGVYAYRVDFLRAFSGLEPSSAERAESLEQLRALHHGHPITVVRLPQATPPGIDTPKDWERFSQYINSL
ncbi:MAG: 3-deoxy-manno-octulosonate cytidylyltransferase [Pseudomonadota bacterium]